MTKKLSPITIGLLGLTFLLTNCANKAEIATDSTQPVSPTLLATGSASTWSPDGQKIAFVSVRDRNHEIYIMNRDGTGQTRLTNNSYNEYKQIWSQDGKQIAFNSHNNGNNDLYVIAADGTQETQLTNSPESDLDPTWSGDSKFLAFTSFTDVSEAKIYLVKTRE
ncbi:TolB family protein [Limnofasciculus baicalensis]|uniref:Uncharacterized protein n=1 Tax=Limnofasciculus baicalensis BBK-W-15 TaxID=2699891 RepID=A0AAE3KQQ4_9CYAN|nr:hypothetical protein [Limnofasciculus baicalensis]MCP2727622.1 hypothetical protein [Limnofasciculus baicalensis BBK-W-15]